MNGTLAIVKPLPYMPVKADTEDWNTPPELLEVVREVLGDIDLDPCGNPWSRVGAKRQVWLPSWLEPVEPVAADEARGIKAVEGRPAFEATPDVIVGDGSLVPWSGTVFFNPPYNGKGLSLFMGCAAGALQRDVPSIGLLPIKSEQPSWQSYVPHAAAVCFIKGRVKFLLPGGARNGATFPSCLVLWARSRELRHRFALRCDGRVGQVMRQA